LGRRLVDLGHTGRVQYCSSFNAVYHSHGCI